MLPGDVVAPLKLRDLFQVKSLTTTETPQRAVLVHWATGATVRHPPLGCVTEVSVEDLVSVEQPNLVTHSATALQQRSQRDSAPTACHSATA